MRLKEVVGRMRLDAYQLTDAAIKIKNDAVELLRSEEVERFRADAAKRIKAETARIKAELEKLRAFRAVSLDHFVNLVDRNGISQITITPYERRLGHSPDTRQQMDYYTEYRTLDPGKRVILYEESHIKPFIERDSRGSVRDSALSLKNFMTADQRLVHLRTRLPRAFVTFGLSMTDAQHQMILDQARAKSITPFPSQPR